MQVVVEVIFVGKTTLRHHPAKAALRATKKPALWARA
jgi:hypothetical protein